MPCNNPENQKFCTGIDNYSFGCLKVNKSNNYPGLFSWMGPAEDGILVKLFELKEILLKKKMINFSAQGFCMYPCIRPTDKLHIELKKAEQIKIGEVAVYCRHNLLFAHRTIGKGNEHGLNYIVTRPDTAKSGDDGPSFDDNIVGVVSSIERKGRILSVEIKTSSLIKEFYLKIFFTILKLKQIVVKVCLYLLAFLQLFSVGRKVFKLFFKNTEDLRFSISVPLNNNINSLFNTSISDDELIELNHQESEDKILKWAVVLNAGSRLAAYLSFVRKPETCPFAGWWLAEAKISPQCRAGGVQEKIWQKADELLGLLEAPSIFAGILKKDYFLRMFFQSLGFKENPAYKDPLNRRIILERRIPA
jgi:hypothetical protein